MHDENHTTSLRLLEMMFQAHARQLPYGASSNILKPRLRLEEKHSNLAALDEMQLIRQLR